MGQSNSINQSSFQDTENQINQISNQTCTTTCLADINASITVKNTKNYTVNIKDGCFITGSSCTLKAALNNSLTNTQTDKETSKISGGSDPIPVINFGSNDIDQENYQKIGNQVTQDINSLCQLNSESNINAPILIENADGGSYNLGLQSKITNQSCIIENAASSKVTNSQSNTMSATIVGVDCLSAIMNSIGVIVIMGGLVGMASTTGQAYVRGKKAEGEVLAKEIELNAQATANAQAQASGEAPPGYTPGEGEKTEGIPMTEEEKKLNEKAFN